MPLPPSATPQGASPPRDLPRTASRLLALQVAVAATAALYFGREILMPLAFAILLSFVLAPGVRLLQKARLPRAGAVLVVAFVAFAGIAGLAGVVATQVASLVAELPNYERTIRGKVEVVRQLAAGNGTLDRAAELVESLGKEIERPQRKVAGLPPEPPDSDDPRPVPVEIRSTESGPLKTLANVGNALLHPLATTGLIAIFVIFFLIQREELRNRMIRLAGSRDLHRTTAAIDDAARRLSRYFVTQLALNTAFGAVIGLGLWLIGVPSPALWGILAAILRFVPYVGAFIAALLPIALSAAVDPGWTMILWTAALFIVVEPLVGHVIEPLVYGHSTGLSPVAVVIAATFWTWLWGPVGLVMATPLTACVVVLGRHVEKLAVFDVLLGDRPALTPPEVFYQRMLAGDPVEAIEQAETRLKDAELSEYLDTVALPGLHLASEDELRGALDAGRMERIRDTVAEVAVELEDDTPLPLGDDAPVDMVCIGVRTPLDEAAGGLFRVLARSEGLSVRTLGPDSLALANLFSLDLARAPVICLSLLATPSAVHVRHALRRLRRKAPGAHFIVGAWQESGATTADDLRRAAAPDAVATTFAEALALAREAIRPTAVAEPAAETVA